MYDKYKISIKKINIVLKNYKYTDNIFKRFYTTKLIKNNVNLYYKSINKTLKPASSLISIRFIRYLTIKNYSYFFKKFFFIKNATYFFLKTLYDTPIKRTNKINYFFYKSCFRSVLKIFSELEFKIIFEYGNNISEFQRFYNNTNFYNTALSFLLYKKTCKAR